MKKYILSISFLITTAAPIFAAYALADNVGIAQDTTQKVYDVSENTYDMVCNYYRTGHMPTRDEAIAQYGWGATHIRDDLNRIINTEGLSAQTPYEQIPSLAAERHIVLRYNNQQLDCYEEKLILDAGIIGRIQRWTSTAGFKATCAGAIAGIITYYLIKSYNKNLERRKDRRSPKWAFGVATVVGLGTFAYLQHGAATLAAQPE